MVGPFSSAYRTYAWAADSSKRYVQVDEWKVSPSDLLGAWALDKWRGNVSESEVRVKLRRVVNGKLLSGSLSLSVKLRTEMLLLIDLSVRCRRLYDGLLDAMVLHTVLVDLVKVLFLMAVFLGRRCWVINVSLSRKKWPCKPHKSRKRQKWLNSTDLLSHNNVGFSIF